MITEIEVQNIFEWLNEHESRIAKAKALVYVWEKGEKSKKADLMRECVETSSAAKETYAYAHEAYKAYTKTVSDMIEQYEDLKLQRETKLAMLEVYRTQQATQRQMVKGFA